MEQSNNSNSLINQVAMDAEAAKKAEEELLRQRYRNLRGQLSECSSALANLINAANVLYTSMKTNINIDGRTIQEGEIKSIKDNSASIKSSIDGIISSISSKC